MVSVSSVCVFVRLRLFVFMCGASAMKVNAGTCAPATDRDLDCWDLKDGACSPRTVKSGETLVDARRVTANRSLCSGFGTRDKQNHQDYWSPTAC